MDARALKISQTMKARKLDNFKKWRDQMKALGKIKSSYPKLKKNGDLAELIGVVLGDGHLYEHDRCDSLRITGDAVKMDFVYRAALLVEQVFGKKPSIAKVTVSNAVTVTIYEKQIASRLGLPYGSRAKYKYTPPSWILKKKANKLRFLRGLYEAEGSVAYHMPTYTHKIFFSNTNKYLLDLVAKLVRSLGFTVNVSTCRVQVSRKNEVQKLKNLLEFRSY